MSSLVTRLSKRLKVVPSGCWEWQGYCDRNGYGQIGSGGKYGPTLYTHRALWEIVFGSIPGGLCVLHFCDNPSCCNPAHLFLGTRTDNAIDRDAKDRVAYGEEHYAAKLTQKDVHAIREDSRVHRLIAADYGVNASLISMIQNGKRWRRAA